MSMTRAGTQYAYAVVQTATEEAMALLEASPPADLAEALLRGAKAVKSVPPLGPELAPTPNQVST